LVERPLFIKGRKPVNEPVPESVPVAATKKIEVFVWELTGIFTTPKGVTAFFSRINAKVPKDNYRKYKIGDELDGWKLTEIHADNVVLTQANETKTLPLRKLKLKSSIPTTNRVPSPPPQQSSPPPQQMQQGGMPPQQMQQGGMPPQQMQQGIPQQMQTPEAMQNMVNPQEDESVEAVQQ
jgi:hypothetical protein